MFLQKGVYDNKTEFSSTLTHEGNRELLDLDPTIMPKYIVSNIITLLYYVVIYYAGISKFRLWWLN